jgi:ABC-type arginine/histidine transport system permease subunit
LKISIPGIVNVAVGLFKDTTLVSVISMFDLVGMIRGPDSCLDRMERRLLGAFMLCFRSVLHRLLRHFAIFAVAGTSLATDHR